MMMFHVYGHVFCNFRFNSSISCNFKATLKNEMHLGFNFFKSENRDFSFIYLNICFWQQIFCLYDVQIIAKTGHNCNTKYGAVYLDTECSCFQNCEVLKMLNLKSNWMLNCLLVLPALLLFCMKIVPNCTAPASCSSLTFDP